MQSLLVSFYKLINSIYLYLNGLYVPHAPRWQRYGLVILLITLFFLVKATISATLQEDVPFLFSLFIVILSAWFGGLGPGLLATFLTGILTYYLFLEPKLSFSAQDNIANIFFVVIFIIEGSFISFLSESRRRSDAQKSEFIGVISHELKNPLTSIKGYAELIEKHSKTKDPKLSEFANRINSQIGQVIAMINDLLDITKIETGRLTYQDEIFNIQELLKEVVSDQQVTTKTHKIILSGHSKKLLNGDRYRIGQVIINLVNNAIKYSPNSGKINVNLKNNRHHVIISIKDYGVGISKADRTRLFTPYFRASNSRVAKGTGIGLYISSEIVKRHNGKLRIQSQVSKGSTFYLELPVARGESISKY